MSNKVKKTESKWYMNVLEWGKRYRHYIATVLIFVLMLGGGLFAYKQVIEPAKDSYVGKNVVENSENSEYDDTTIGYMLPGQEIRQTFCSNIDVLEGVAVVYGTYDTENKGTLTMSVYDNESGELVQTMLVNMADIENNEKFDLIFDTPVENAMGKSFELVINVVEGEQTNALTIWASTALYEQGNLTIDGEDQSCNLMVQVLEGDNGFIVIAYVISLCFLTLVIYVVYYMVFIKKSKIEKIFLVILCAMGVMYMAIMTPYSVPDEGSHIRRMYIDTNKILGIEEAREGYYYMRYDDATIGLTREPCLYSYKTVWNHFFDMAENTELVEVEGRTVSAPFYLYLPGEIVFLFCRLLNIGPVMMFTLARIANFAFFVFMAYWGMKKLPFGKMVLFTICLMPMTVQMAASCSYDSIMNALSIGFMCYCLYLTFGEEKKISIKQLILLGILGVLIAPTKNGAYIPLCFLVLLIPQAKFENKKKYLTSIGLVLLVCVAAFCVTGITSILWSVSGSAEGTDNMIAWAGEPGYSLTYFLHNPLQLIRIAVNTLNVKGGFYFKSMIGYRLGWLNIPVADMVISGFAVVLALSALKRVNEKQYFTTGKKLWTFVVIAGCVCLIELGMLLNWTPQSYPYVEGVQGRYFLPFLLPAVLLLRNNRLVVTKSIDNGLIISICILQLLTMEKVIEATIMFVG
jgi:uncharacterized membrane protein